MNFSAAPLYLSMPTPATVKYAPFAFGVPPSERWKIASVVYPSGRNSITPPPALVGLLVFGPSTLTLSLISWPLFSSTRPPMKIASGFVFLIRVNSAWKFVDFGSKAEKPDTLMPSDFSAPSVFLATPRP